MVFSRSNSNKNCFDCSDKSCAAVSLSNHEVELLHENSHETSFRKGDIILHEGSLTSHIIYLRSGLAKEFITNSENKEQILQIIKKYSYLGLPSLFGDKVNHFSYAALEDLKVCYIDISVFNNLIRKNGNFAYNILVSICRDNLNNSHRFMSMSQKKTYGKVADVLIYFSDIIYEDVSYDMPFSRQELADLIGISRESATRVLSKFKEDGIIEFEKKKITIRNPELLKQVANFG